MAGTGPNEDEIARPDRKRLFREDRLPSPLDEEEELVGRGMDFLADFATLRDCHDHHLLVIPGHNFSAEGIVRPRRLDDVRLCRPLSCSL